MKKTQSLTNRLAAVAMQMRHFIWVQMVIMKGRKEIAKMQEDVFNLTIQPVPISRVIGTRLQA